MIPVAGENVIGHDAQIGFRGAGTGTFAVPHPVSLFGDVDHSCIGNDLIGKVLHQFLTNQFRRLRLIEEQKVRAFGQSCDNRIEIADGKPDLEPGGAGRFHLLNGRGDRRRHQRLGVRVSGLFHESLVERHFVVAVEILQRRSRREILHPVEKFRFLHRGKMEEILHRIEPEIQFGFSCRQQRRGQKQERTQQRLHVKHAFFSIPVSPDSRATEWQRHPGRDKKPANDFQRQNTGSSFIMSGVI